VHKQPLAAGSYSLTYAKTGGEEKGNEKESKEWEEGVPSPSDCLWIEGRELPGPGVKAARKSLVAIILIILGLYDFIVITGNVTNVITILITWPFALVCTAVTISLNQGPKRSRGLRTLTV